MEKPFEPLPPVPDHPALEREILAWWESEGIFERLREQNRGRDKWSFVDGPKTANTVDGLGVHHLWGRTYKDVFQRYKALRGFDQRFQNGFDCQGLWVEVKVERDLGLNSKREIEDYGLAEFARRCRELVAESARVITEQSKRLGQWMDWGNDYYTFSDTNIEYIWRFLKTVHERGWLYLGHRSTEWCPRCGTSISQHELSQSDVYKEKSDPSLFVRFPLRGRDDEALVIWTTTPWTLPANVAAAVNPEAEYGRRENGEWVAVARYPEDTFVERAKGAELVGWEYEGPYDHFEPGGGVRHRVIAWDDVSMEDGTGIVHIAPGAGTEDFELSRVHDLPVLVPVDESGRFLPEYGWLHGVSTVEAAEQIVGDLRERGLLENAETYVHRYAHCWRCSTPVIFRVVEDWFIAVDELRQPLLDANASVDWTPDFYGKRMEDWLRNMGDWNISRKRYFGLPLPFYPCECGHVNVIGSRAELEERAVSGLDQLEELHRPWVDEVPIRCEQCDAEVRRVPEVGDVWLDAGIVPFSTLGWRNEKWIEGGYATGASKELSAADLPDHAYWEEWFPADWVTEMREQIRLWFYAQLFMSVALDGRAPFARVLGHEDVKDEHGHEMHNSKGNAIEAGEALERMGADVVRWMFCEQAPTQGVKFGYTPAGDIKRRLLTLWNSASFLVTYANIEGWRPRYEDLERGPEGDLRPLDCWLVARTQKFVADTEDAYERYWTRDVVRGFDAFVDDVSNWYIRRSRRRFYSLEEPAAFAALWYALVQAVRAIAPVMPFLAEHLWRLLTAPADGAPASVHLAGWPARAQWDDELVGEVAEVRRVVELGRQARSSSGMKLRQPLRRMVVQGASSATRHEDEIREELRVKEVEFAPVEFREVTVKPNLPIVGPRLGKQLDEVRQLLAAGDWEWTDEGGVRVGKHELGRSEILVERSAGAGWALAEDGELAVALDLRVDAELEREGRVLDLIHRLNSLRREARLELTQLVDVALPERDRDLLVYEDWIRSEVLAMDIGVERGLDEAEVRPLGATHRVVELVDKASATADRWLDVATALEKAAPGRPSPASPFAPFVLAFYYDLTQPQEVDRRAEWGVFAPMTSWDGDSFPPRLEDADERHVAAWASAYKVVGSPVARSRLADLVWERRFGEHPYRAAQGAVDAYLELGERWSDLDRADSLARAVELSRAISDDGRLRRSIAQMLDATRSALSEDEWKPGVPLRMLRVLVDLPAAQRPQALAELLKEAASRYESDPFIAESVSELQAAAETDEEKRLDLRRRTVQRWREAAHKATGLLRLTHLQHASEEARKHGLTALVQEIQLDLQQLSPQELDLQRFEAEIPLDPAEVEGLLNALVGRDSWTGFIQRFGSYGPPSGEFESNVATVKRMMESHPIQFLFQRVELGPENTTIKHISSAEDKEAAELVKHEAMGIRIWSQLAVPALLGARERYGPPETEVLARSMAGEIVDEAVANRFAQAFALWSEERFDEAGHVLVPRLEASLRSLARHAGLVVTREPFGTRLGGVVALGELLSGLEGRLDESWRRYLRTLLTEPLGLNLRNRVAHGLVSHVSAQDAAVLLHAAAFVALLAPVAPQTPR